MTFIDEVRSIVLSHMADEKFGVRDLAEKLNLSSSQTLRKIRKATGKSVNRYIRELRLEKAAKLLKTTDQTAAEISHQVGFGSPSYFNKSFSKYYGIAPGEYKTKSISLSELATQQAETPSRSFFRSKKLIYAISAVLLFVAGYFIVKSMVGNNKTLPNSIAVLPFKDLSPDDNQWFSDGVSDNIIHSFAQMEDMKVISFTSSSTYRDTDKKIPEIAKELGVSYILEGSATLHDNKIKVIAQLIDSKDQHLWSREYDKDVDDIITIQKNIAQEIVKQLEVSLSPLEEIVLKKYPTENMDAYYLYMQAEGILNPEKSIKDIELKIDLLSQAIELDTNFADAYASQASAYYQLFHRYSSSFDPLLMRNKVDYNADKALAIDPNCVVALIQKSNLTDYVDWDKSKEYLEKALEISPSSYRVRVAYSVYFNMIPNYDIKEFLHQSSLAYELNPLSMVASSNYINALLVNNKIDEIEAYFENDKFVLSEYGRLHFLEMVEVFKSKDWRSAITFRENLIEKEPDNTLQYAVLASHYNNILGDKEAALKISQKAVEIDSNKVGNLNYYLISSDKFNEAEKLMSSKKYNAVVSNADKLRQQWLLHYNRNELDKAMQVLDDSIFKNQYWFRTITYAKMGNRKKVDSMNKRFPWGTGRISDWRIKKATLHAVMKDKDSMYDYLENLISLPGWASRVNGDREFDPYRHEERFKAIQRKLYLPVLGEN